MQEIAAQVDGILVVEMNAGQMLLDVQRLVNGKAPVEFFGRVGGKMPFPDEVLTEIRRMAAGPLPVNGDAVARWLARSEKVN